MDRKIPFSKNEIIAANQYVIKNPILFLPVQTPMKLTDNIHCLFKLREKICGKTDSNVSKIPHCSGNILPEHAVLLDREMSFLRLIQMERYFQPDNTISKKSTGIVSKQRLLEITCLILESEDIEECLLHIKELKNIITIFQKDYFHPTNHYTLSCRIAMRKLIALAWGNKEDLIEIHENLPFEIKYEEERLRLFRLYQIELPEKVIENYQEEKTFWKKHLMIFGILSKKEGAGDTNIILFENPTTKKIRTA